MAVYVKGVRQISDAVQAAIARQTDPWERLEAACIAHLEAILQATDYAQVVVRVRPADVPAAAEQPGGAAQPVRSLFAELVDALPCRAAPTGDACG